MKHDANTFFPVSQEFSRQKLQQITGVPDDVLGFWLKQNLIVPMPAVRRAHRRFGYEQINLAALLNAMRSLGVSSFVMKKFSTGIQHGFAKLEGTELSFSEAEGATNLAQRLDNFRRGGHEKVHHDGDGNFLAMGRAAESEDDIIHWCRAFCGIEQNFEEMLRFAKSLTANDIKWIEVALDIIRPSILISSNEGYRFSWLCWVDEGGDPNFSFVGSGFPGTETYPYAAFFIAVSDIIRSVWPNEAREARLAHNGDEVATR